MVDGTPDEANKLEALIRDKLSHLQGAKRAWEVRLLRHDRTDRGRLRQALLENPDFLWQHTDSNSTGLVELTESHEAVVRDLRDWNNQRDPVFLVDVAEGKLHYYHSKKHRETSFYKAGENPEIFSVIRFLTKAFQGGYPPTYNRLSEAFKLGLTVESCAKALADLAP